VEDTGAVQPGDPHHRRHSGGRKSIKKHYPDIIHELKELPESYTKGDRENPLQHTDRSTRKSIGGKRIFRKGYGYYRPHLRRRGITCR
jgi:hypothetical protein